MAATVVVILRRFMVGGTAKQGPRFRVARWRDERTNRDFDIVLFGATGFTGGLTADYLAAHAPDGLRWAIAGRNADKLEAVRQRLGRLFDVQVLVADSTDPAALADVARRARVVVTTIGPYLQHGGPLVAACAEAGTDYLDLTGEPEFVDRTYLAHHQTAVRTGARLVHACGFDSIPTTSAPTSPWSSRRPTSRSRCAAWSARPARSPAAPSTPRWTSSRAPRT